MQPSAKSSKIDDYAVIGDCRATALVSNLGSVDWLCWPRFDSPAIFAAVLDPRAGGAWSIAPVNFTGVKRNYVGPSNILETNFSSPGGSARLTDLMPVSAQDEKARQLAPDHELIRRMECSNGEVEVMIDFSPRTYYGHGTVKIKDRGNFGLQISVGRGIYCLRANVRLEILGGRASARTRLKQGEAIEFSLTYSENAPAVLPSLGPELNERIRKSLDWWQRWSGRCSYDGPYRDAVLRSALTLKLLSYAPSGAVVAAATTSLPEIIGGGLNWDYRYCWLRDASFTVRSLLGLGYREEAESFLNWMLLATRLTQPRLEVLYDVYGRRSPREQTLGWLSGYEDSRPVRVGNAARDQLQLDVYGEVIDAAAHFVRDGGQLDRMMQSAVVGFGRKVAESWRLPDEGIWEPRFGRRPNTYSRLMCWVALDRLIALAEAGSLRKAPIEAFQQERGKIEQEIRARAWNERLQSYVSVLDSDDLDATLLLLPWFGFERADSPRMQATYRAVCRVLNAGNGLLYRYPREHAEGAFGVCSFWAAEFLALGGGTLAQAHYQFDTALRHKNDVGLFSEEISPATGEALGNFPQAYTHVGVISAALTLQEQAAEAQPGRDAA